MSYVGTNVVSAVPALVRCLSDADLELARAAAYSLGRLPVVAEVTGPALGKALQDPRPGVRSNSARALCWLGDRARPALPYLICALNDSNRDTREWVTNAILKIAPEVLVGAARESNVQSPKSEDQGKGREN